VLIVFVGLVLSESGGGHKKAAPEHKGAPAVADDAAVAKPAKAGARKTPVKKTG
jgi:hypothetical protein